MKMKLFVLLIFAVFASEKKENDAKYGPENEEIYDDNPIIVKIEEDEYVKVNKKSIYIGVSYNKDMSKWRTQRHSKLENKKIYNGCYDDEETAAHASDTLARKLMQNGEQKLKLNFSDDYTKVHSEEFKITTSKYIGVSNHNDSSRWYVQRYSKNENKTVYNGCYDNEEKAAHASDTLARNLMKKGQQKLKLNFPDDRTEVHREEKDASSKYIGVIYNKNRSKWYVLRWSKNENKTVSNGCYDDEETTAHASDTLARKLMDKGEQNHKLNFPDDYTEVCPEKNHKKKRKRPKD